MDRSSDSRLTARVSACPSIVCIAAAAIWTLVAIVPATHAQESNTKASRILGMFDIDGRGGPDVSVDSDGDGLPDSWEVGGLDAAGTDVPFPSPQAIVPGTPPVSIFSRRPVRTSATSRDTDGDGLTDFVEVFGLKFIDDNSNGLLDDATVRDGDGNIQFNDDGTPQRATDENGNPTGEWFDFNGDGMPSIGEFPARNILVPGASENYDFDGFVFTDPINPDTDGDGVSDGSDNDPLINPRSFGVGGSFFPSGSSGAAATDADFDNDGLGNGMDLGNDVTQLIDNPSDLRLVLEVFRPDLLTQTSIRIPEGLIEDLLGADWNGDGLFRLTDIQDPHFGLIAAPRISASNIDLFSIEDPDTEDDFLSLGFTVTSFPDAFRRTAYYTFATRGEGGLNAPLAYQEVLVPAGRGDNVFLPDPRIWTVLYSWRMPGFDIDGNGFIGYDGASFSGLIEVNGELIPASNRVNDAATPSSEHGIPGTGSTNSTSAIPSLDGVVQSQFPSFCSGLGFSLVSLCAVGTFMTHRRRKFARR